MRNRPLGGLWTFGSNKLNTILAQYTHFNRPIMPALYHIRGTLDGESTRLAAAILAGADVERVLALHFNIKHRLIGVHVVSVGTLDAALVSPRDTFKAALLSNAAAVVIAHNHPSGDPTPSGEDRALCDRLRQAGELLGVTLLDFVIVTDPAEGVRYHSFRERGGLS